MHMQMTVLEMYLAPPSLSPSLTADFPRSLTMQMMTYKLGVLNLRRGCHLDPDKQGKKLRQATHTCAEIVSSVGRHFTTRFCHDLTATSDYRWHHVFSIPYHIHPSTRKFVIVNMTLWYLRQEPGLASLFLSLGENTSFSSWLELPFTKYYFHLL